MGGVCQDVGAAGQPVLPGDRLAETVGRVILFNSCDGPGYTKEGVWHIYG